MPLLVRTLHKLCNRDGKQGTYRQSSVVWHCRVLWVEHRLCADTVQSRSACEYFLRVLSKSEGSNVDTGVFSAGPGREIEIRRKFSGCVPKETAGHDSWHPECFRAGFLGNEASTGDYPAILGKPVSFISNSNFAVAVNFSYLLVSVESNRIFRLRFPPAAGKA